METIITVSKYLDIAGPLLGVLLSIQLLFSKQKVRGYMPIFCYLLLQLIANSIAKYMGYHFIPNARVYQANAFFSLVIITWFFLKEFKKIAVASRFLLLQIFAALSICLIIPILFFEDTRTLNSHSLSFTALCACLYSLTYYTTILTRITEGSLLQSKSFWNVTALFLYYSTCFFIYVMYKIFTDNGHENFGVLWSIHNFILFISCCILGIVNKKAAS